LISLISSQTFPRSPSLEVMINDPVLAITNFRVIKEDCCTQYYYDKKIPFLL